MIVPEGYTAQVLYRWGDSTGIAGNMPAFKSNAGNSAVDQAVQAGMHHDGTANWSLEKARKGQNVMGISVVEVRRDPNGWQVVRPSLFARRITANTPMSVTGPARGHSLMRTEADSQGALVLGIMQNCANGRTPWGTYLTCEENWSDIFTNNSGEITPLEKRYGIGKEENDYLCGAKWTSVSTVAKIRMSPTASAGLSKSTRSIQNLLRANIPVWAASNMKAPR
ncbi:PhoX family protein [Neisseria weixii]|uniref:PhoX family protein n=1 Tax=Neisseria weixii TaxID=1853276 RepID=UPI00210735DE|nr:alkaline phosphatase PhoX [Neisseria weixii]